jgi:hypothetical protein
MAQKVWIGKSNHSNIGNTGDKYGLWSTRKNMSSCTKDEINLNTDTFGNASGAIDIGQFQVIPTSGTTASQEISISASQTITVSYVDQSTSNNFVQPYFSYGEYSSTGSNVSQYMQAAGYGGTSSVSMSNSGGNAITGTVTTWRGFSSSALF